MVITMTERRVFRRRWLTTVGVGLSAGLAGCSLPGVGGIGGAALPKLTGAWLSIDKSGSGKFVFTFDGDIQSALDTAGVSRENVVDIAAEKGLDLRFEPVTIDRRAELSDEPVSEPQRLLQGEITDFADVTSVVGRNRYATHRVTYEKEVADPPTQTTTAGECTQYARPQGVPSRPAVPFWVLFPDGGRYLFPRAQEIATSATAVSAPTLDNSPFNYGNRPTNRTFPFIIHYDNPQLVAMRTAAQYRAGLVRSVYRFYNFEYYECQAYEQVRTAMAAIVKRLGKEGVSAIITAPLPTALTGPLDVKGFHDAFTDEYPKLQEALSSLEELGIAAVNNAWLGELTPGPVGGAETRGLEYLHLAAVVEAGLVNLGLAASRDANEFEQRLATYDRLLREQSSALDGLLAPDSTFRSVGTFGNRYWERLHQSAVTLLRESRGLVQREQRLLEQVRADLSQ
jgi:hypothetical protein